LFKFWHCVTAKASFEASNVWLKLHKQYRSESCMGLIVTYIPFVLVENVFMRKIVFSVWLLSKK